MGGLGAILRALCASFVFATASYAVNCVDATTLLAEDVALLDTSRASSRAPSSINEQPTLTPEQYAALPTAAHLPGQEGPDIAGVYIPGFNNQARHFLAAGGQGIVFRMGDESGVKQAVKVPLRNPSTIRELGRAAFWLKNEANAYEKISKGKHPGLVHLIKPEYVEEHGHPSLQMDYLEGPSLSQYAGKLSPQEIVDVGIQAAYGIEAIHAADMVHADIKLENMHRDEKGHVTILDYGLANNVRTPFQMAYGTTGYLPSDQAAPDGFLSKRRDIFAAMVAIEKLLVPPEEEFKGMTYRCNDGGIPNPKYITTRLRLSAYSTREKLIELGLRKRGTPEEESLIEMISSLTHAKAAVLSAHGVNQSFKAIKEAAKTGDQDKWFKEHYFPMLIEAEESEQISSFRLARLIYSDGPAVARLLDGRSGLPAEKVEAIKRIANTLLEPNSSAGLIDQSEVSPYFAPEAGR